MKSFNNRNMPLQFQSFNDIINNEFEIRLIELATVKRKCFKKEETALYNGLNELVEKC